MNTPVALFIPSEEELRLLIQTNVLLGLVTGILILLVFGAVMLDSVTWIRRRHHH